MNAKEKFGRKPSRPNMRRNMSACWESLKNVSVKIVDLQTENWTQDLSKTIMSGIRSNRTLYSFGGYNCLQTIYEQIKDLSLPMFSFFFTFVSSWLHLRVLKGKAEIETAQERLCTGHFLHEKVIRIWSWEWSILCWQCSVWTCVQSLQSLIYAHMVPCIEFPCSVFRHSLHIHTGHTWFWDSYYHQIYHSDLSRSFSTLCWRKCKNTPIGFDMSVCPSARNNSQPTFHKCLHIFANTAVFRTNNKRDSSNLEIVTDGILHKWLHYTHTS